MKRNGTSSELIFLDSSVLIEGLKGNPLAISLFEKLLRSDLIPVINDIVFSEFLFHYIALKTGVSPFTVKKRAKSTMLYFPRNQRIYRTVPRTSHR